MPRDALKRGSVIFANLMWHRATLLWRPWRPTKRINVWCKIRYCTYIAMLFNAYKKNHTGVYHFVLHAYIRPAEVIKTLSNVAVTVAKQGSTVGLIHQQCTWTRCVSTTRWHKTLLLLEVCFELRRPYVSILILPKSVSNDNGLSEDLLGL